MRATPPIDPDLIVRSNKVAAAAHQEDYEALARQLSRRGFDIEAVTSKVAGFGVAIPSWGVGTGGTRFAPFQDVASRAASSTSSTTALWYTNSVE
jgi:L-rhamnose isomerase